MSPLFFASSEYFCLVQTTRLLIADFLKEFTSHLLLDVRSPAEYEHAHLPGAINLPLFSNDERKAVGTAYKQESREKAIKIGLDIFGPKMRSIVEEVEKLIGASSNPADRKVFIYCWRGGMRSGAVAWLLGLYGFKVYVLAGGYKAFRRWVLESFTYPHRFTVLGGYTGSGKTKILNTLEQQGEAVIDLEDLAHHRGSAFGRIDDNEPTQEMFENKVAMRFLAIYGGAAFDVFKTSIWIEDESQRIGRINIPVGFWKTMRDAPVWFLDIPFEERLNNLVVDYGSCPIQNLKEASQRISKRLGGLETKNVLGFLEEGAIKEAFSILLQYYDKRYSKGLHNRENAPTLINKVPCKTVTSENAQTLLHQYQTL